MIFSFKTILETVNGFGFGRFVGLFELIFQKATNPQSINNLLIIALIFFFSAKGHSDLISVNSNEQERVALAKNWSRDLEESFLQAQQEQKVLIVAFLGENWCPWSEKLKRDVLNAPEFLRCFEGIGHFAVALIDQEGSTHNKALQKVFHVDQTPTVILFDYSHEEIARLGFLPVTPEQYAQSAIKLIEQFEEVITFLKNPRGGATEEEIKSIYLKAKELSSRLYKNQILQMGLKREKGSFFLLEKYEDLLKQFKLKSQVVQKVRKQLIEKDPDNKRGTQLKIALLEFDALSSKESGKNKIDKVISPLVHYLKKFGKQDRENLWKVEMMIAQFLFTKKEQEQALAYARASLAEAPDEMKQQVQEMVDYLKDLH